MCFPCIQEDTESLPFNTFVHKTAEKIMANILKD